jgi:O-antigen/teichoic acid export membrane protein
MLAAYGVGVVGVAELLGGDLLGFLFGAEFASMEETFILLSVGVAWYSAGYPAGYSLIADDRNMLFLAGAGAAGATNLALNLALIPPFGPIGAGIATAVAFGIASCIWLVARGLAALAARLLLPALGVASAGAVAALVLDDARTAIGAITLVLAAAMLTVRLVGRHPAG